MRSTGKMQYNKIISEYNLEYLLDAFSLWLGAFLMSYFCRFFSYPVFSQLFDSISERIFFNDCKRRAEENYHFSVF